MRITFIEVAVVFILALVGLIVPLLALNLWETQFLDVIKQDAALGHALVPLLQLLPQWVSMHVLGNYVTYYTIHQVTARHTMHQVSIMRMHFTCPSKAVVLFMFVLFVKQLKESAYYVLKEPTHEAAVSVLNMIMAFMLVLAGMASLDIFHDAVWQWARKDEDEVLESTVVKKWRSISQEFSKWGQPEKDKVYSFPEHGNHISPALVLAEIVSMYLLLMKAIAAVTWWLSVSCLLFCNIQAYPLAAPSPATALATGGYS